MEAFVHVLVIAWIGVAVVLFHYFSRPVAVLATVMLGQMCLPEIQSIPVAPSTIKPLRPPLLEFTKLNSISYGLLLAFILHDLSKFQRFRFRFFDLPALLLCVCPSLSSLVNGTTLEAAFALFRSNFLTWGVPYFMGRFYLGDAAGCYLTVTAIAIGGLIYLPFCLFEIRFSPNLHYYVYGFQQHHFAQTIRSGGYRPMVFMQHGLAVGFWMTAACLSLFWLWRTRAWPPPRLPRWIKSNTVVLYFALVVTTVLCKSAGALVLGAVGAIALWLIARLPHRIWLAMLIAMPIGYTVGRAWGWLDRNAIVSAFGKSESNERLKSLDYRLECEDLLIAVVDKSPLLGTIGMKAEGKRTSVRPRDDNNNEIVTDGLWIIQYFDTGVLGLSALLGFFLLPPLLFLKLHPPASWTWLQVAPATVAAVILALYMTDCLFNGLLNPMFLLLAGALNGWNEQVGRYRPFHLAANAQAFADRSQLVFQPSSPK